MSLIIFLFYVAGIPLGIVLMGKRAFSRAENPVQKGIVVTLCIGMFTGLIWLAVGEKWLADRQVRKLCAKDGGIKVYETIQIPKEKFNQWGQPNFYRPTQGEKALGHEYLFKQGTHYYKQGNLELSRRYYQIFRHSDKKLLAEAVIYGRRGGGLPGPWHVKSLNCPALDEGEISLFKAVFIKSDGDE